MVRRTEEKVNRKAASTGKSQRRPQLDVLNAKEIKALNVTLKEAFGFTIPKSCTLLRGRKDKINIVNRDIGKLNLAGLRIERAGLYFCSLDKYGIRLSIEGSQLFRKEISKNVIEITYPQLRLWLFGKDLELSEEQVEAVGKELGTFYVLHHQDDFCGCGRLIQENNGTETKSIVQNFVPKERRTGTVE